MTKYAILLQPVQKHFLGLLAISKEKPEARVLLIMGAMLKLLDGLYDEHDDISLWTPWFGLLVSPALTWC